MADEKKTLEDLKDITAEALAKAPSPESADAVPQELTDAVPEPKIDAQGRSYGFA